MNTTMDTERWLSLEEFFADLRRTPRDWYLTGQEAMRPGMIRRRNAAKGRPGDDMECPVCALHPTKRLDVFNAGRELGLSHDAVQRLMQAADLRGSDPALRARLLLACGLEEGWPSP